ncbi:alpha/beta hydrolase fold domain-containing protein [Pseudokineococcus sp. 1T1Z-3]|uniref:alpha/beta hydrolase fold domain-containing protein n=1 Tax=Pseudokineococcus sp. 1T1Z-3 TaxID=3132745 RepID=UPI0030AD746C
MTPTPAAAAATTRPSVPLRVVNALLGVLSRPPRDAAAAERSRLVSQRRGPARPGWAVRRACDISRSTLAGLPVVTVAPRGRTPSSVLVYVHGGAYVGPPLSQHWDLMAALAKEADATVLAPLYPLAPQGTAAPVVAAMVELHRELLARDGVAPAWAGDSAGGGLALATALALRAAGEPLPPHLALLAPWVDLSLRNPGIAAFAGRDRLLDVAALRHDGDLWRAGLPVDDPRVSPVVADLQGLPPLTVVVGTRDLFTPDCRLLAERARAAGVDVVLEEYAEGFHVFPAVTWLPESRAARRTVVRRLTART